MKHDCDIDQQLKQSGLRCTKDRHDLFALFLQKRAWSASQIAKEFPRKDLSTIYRNLQKLQVCGLIRSVHTHTTEEFFERSSPTHHDHQTCPTCSVLFCIPCPIDSLRQAHVLELTQTCQHCL